ncbi:MAG: hypothetical protein FWC65_02990, partial [Treponema sp.]|nr:hypothetical protein [Treponema sp.]
TEFSEFDIPLGDEGALPEEEEDLPGFIVDETEELSELREAGVGPMAYAPEPEDSDYLTEEAPLSLDSIEDSIDLSEAVIDEPDLSSQIQDNPVEEPPLEDISLEDIAIDLDMEEDISIAEDIFTEKDDGLDSEFGSFGEEGEEMELSMDLSSDTSGDVSGGDLSLIPEGFVVEADAPESDSIALDSAEYNSGEEDDAISMDDIDNFVTGTDETIADIADIVEIDDGIPVIPAEAAEAADAAKKPEAIPTHLKKELRTVLSYMDQLLESLPDDKIEEFAKSEYYDTYKKLFKELGLV